MVNFVSELYKMQLLLPQQHYGFCHAPVCAVRKEPSDCTEMVTQLTFGETVEIRDQKAYWIEITSLTDGYTGYVDRRHLIGISEKELRKWHDERHLQTGLSDTIQTPWGLQMTPAGSFIGDHTDFNIGKYAFQRENGEGELNAESLRLSLLNVPYLWGGKTSFGIDCSGLTQLYYRILGINLPRDAAQQQQEGLQIELDDAQKSDLFFYQNTSGKVTHVGLYVAEQQIYHASGRVRLDSLKNGNIWNEELGEITHQFHSIKRYL